MSTPGATSSAARPDTMPPSAPAGETSPALYSGSMSQGSMALAGTANAISRTTETATNPTRRNVRAIDPMTTPLDLLIITAQRARDS